MLEIKREESFFISKDNKIFTTKEECLKHEKKLKLTNIILIVFVIFGMAYLLYEINILAEELNQKMQ